MANARSALASTFALTFAVRLTGILPIWNSRARATWGATARLPKKPGSQKLTPLSSADATLGVAVTATRHAAAKALPRAHRRIVGSVMSAPELDLAVSACRGLRFSRRLARCMNAAPISAKTGPDHGNVKTSGLTEIEPRDGDNTRFSVRKPGSG